MADLQNGPAQVRVPDNIGEGVKQLFLCFLKEFMLQGEDTSEIHPTPPYLMQAVEMRQKQVATMYVDFSHIIEYDSQLEVSLSDVIQRDYYHVKPFLESAVAAFMSSLDDERKGNDTDIDEDKRDTADLEKQYFVSLYNLEQVSTIRELRTSRLGELMEIKGTVTRTSQVRPELLIGAFACLDCRVEQQLIKQQFKYTEPTACLNPVCENRKSWQLLTQKSSFVDWQMVRLQENPGEIPPGSMPRTMKLIMRSDIVDQGKPGDKCVITGCLIVVPDIAQLARGGSVKMKGSGMSRQSGYRGVTGLKALGVRDLTYKLCFLACAVRAENHVEVPQDGVAEELSVSDQRRILQIRNTPQLYTKLVKSVAPTIFGHDKIKRGILLQLFGGVHKTTKSNQNLRGDINVCIVGDPSTSKSQFLKYVCEFNPRAVYTSGKASSAAGLTASVGRDPETGEFSIQAGALMLADNGICCIDEFDKMDPTDQVAIHEAMEQQTISITKAGIQATLNARTSILAAANPIKGRYDQARTLKQNVDISAPIMSRFDLFFVVLDECDDILDYSIARHILDIHQKKANARACNPVFTMKDMQMYVRFARTMTPKFSPEAKENLSNYYVELRGGDSVGHNNSAYRITVRQLESMIRLSEARAKLELSEVVTAAHVREAFTLLRTSIINVSSHVEIDMQDDEEEEFEGLNDDMDFGGGFNGDDDDDHDDDDSAPGDNGSSTPSNSPGREGTHTQRSNRSESSSSSPGPTEGTPQTQPAAKKSISLSFEKYKAITNLLVMHFRAQQEELNKFTFTTADAVNWYINEEVEANNIRTADDARESTLMMQRIIARLARKDHILTIVQGHKDEMKVVLSVHPNYNPEEGDTNHLKAASKPPSTRAAPQQQQQKRKKKKSKQPQREVNRSSPSRKRKQAQISSSDDESAGEHDQQHNSMSISDIDMEDSGDESPIMGATQTDKQDVFSFGSQLPPSLREQTQVQTRVAATTTTTADTDTQMETQVETQFEVPEPDTQAPTLPQTPQAAPGSKKHKKMKLSPPIGSTSTPERSGFGEEGNQVSPKLQQNYGFSPPSSPGATPGAETSVRLKRKKRK